ncbi:uncharacterized protein G2W53_025801 [Senna tora]|uniref:Uncharacterized protein n=1 Tax=Senna tora TaxID=362788 RepID=A0A834TFL8_9FABA|nr:uncharacterized protein G2W53_025801 [Senna tora]
MAGNFTENLLFRRCNMSRNAKDPMDVGKFPVKWLCSNFSVTNTATSSNSQMAENDDENGILTSATLSKREVNVEHATNQRQLIGLHNSIQDIGVKKGDLEDDASTEEGLVAHWEYNLRGCSAYA